MAEAVERAEISVKSKKGALPKAGKNSRHEFIEMVWKVADWLHEVLPGKWGTEARGCLVGWKVEHQELGFSQGL